MSMRAWVALPTLGLAAWALAAWVATAHPWLGLELRAGLEGQIVVADVHPGGPAAGRLRPGEQVTALVGRQGRILPLVPQDLWPDPDLLPDDAFQAFAARQGRLHALLRRGEVGLVLAGGETVWLRVVPERPLEAVPLVFWLLGGYGVAGLAVVAWAAGTGRSSRAARALLVAAAGFLLLCLALGLLAARTLGLPPEELRLLRQAYHLGGILYAAGLIVLLWGFPRPLGKPWLPALATGWALTWWLAAWVAELPGHDLQVLSTVLGLALIGTVVLQLLASREDPTDRAMVLWLLLAMLPAAAVAVPFYLFVVPGVPLAQVAWPLEVGLGAGLLVLVGGALAVARFRLQEVERWWTEAWIWLFGGVMVLALYLAVAWLFPPLVPLAPFLALAAAGWLYFPLRSFLWSLFYPGVPAPPLGEGLPHRVLEAAAGSGAAAERAWRTLLDELFQPLHMEALPGSPEGGLGAVARPVLLEEGRAMLVPGLQGAGYRLGLPGRGTRLYGEADRELAESVYDLVVRLAAGLEEERRGAVQERQRILADLGRGVGRRLRVLVQRCEGSPAGRIAREALHALEEVIHSTREPGGREALVAAAERWRGQAQERLAACGVALRWRFDPALEGVVLGGVDLLHLGRILQEAVSNAIRHARPRWVEVSLEQRDGWLELRIANDGVRPAADSGHGLGGQGLSNMGRRARELGGALRLEEGEGRFIVTVAVPLPHQAAESDPAAAEAPSEPEGMQP